MSPGLRMKTSIYLPWVGEVPLLSSHPTPPPPLPCEQAICYYHLQSTETKHMIIFIDVILAERSPIWQTAVLKNMLSDEFTACVK